MLKAVHKVGENANEQGFGLVGILASVVIVLAIAGGGFYVWHKDHKTKSNAVATSQNKGSSQTKSSSSKSTTTNPYAGWKTYTSSYEHLSFKYPVDWTATASDTSTEVAGADSLKLMSPSSSVGVTWYSAVEGIGGACSTSVMPGTTVASGELGPCPYFYVLDKQKLVSADLYYVDGVVKQSNGDGYSAWCGLQAPGGILQNESNEGYVLFDSKYNHGTGTNDPEQVGLLCGTDNFGGLVGSQGITKAQATAFLSSAEMQQAKLILLSASY